MKILIWFVCILVMAIIQTIISSSGIILGAIPSVILFLAMWQVATTLCKKYDEKKADRTNNEGNGS